MVNSVLTATSTYAMCTLKLPKGVIDNIDRARKQCLWRGNDTTKKGGNLAAWPIVMKPKNKGGLGVINLSVQNDALLLKHLHKFYYKADVPWMNLIWSKHYSDKVPHATREVGSFWWKDVQRLSTIFRNIARCSLGNGTTVTFWDDLWTDDVLAHRFPRLFSYARNPNISVNEVCLLKILTPSLLCPFHKRLLRSSKRSVSSYSHRPLMKIVKISGHINGAVRHIPRASSTR
jgi:hypothetical protein